MFDIGLWEVSLILLVGLLVIGPDRLPTVARTVGLYVGKLQRFIAGAKSDFRSELESGELRKLIGDQEEQIRELKNIVSDAQREVNDTTQAVSEAWKQQVQEVQDDESLTAVSSASSPQAAAKPTTPPVIKQDDPA